MHFKSVACKTDYRNYNFPPRAIRTGTTFLCPSIQDPPYPTQWQPKSTLGVRLYHWARVCPRQYTSSSFFSSLFPHSKVTERSKYFNMVTYTVTGIERRLTEALISLYHVCGVCPLEIASILTLVKQDVICPGSTCTLPLALSTGATQRGFAVESGHLHLITSPF